MRWHTSQTTQGDKSIQLEVDSVKQDLTNKIYIKTYTSRLKKDHKTNINTLYVGHTKYTERRGE